MNLLLFVIFIVLMIIYILQAYANEKIVHSYYINPDNINALNHNKLGSNFQVYYVSKIGLSCFALIKSPYTVNPQIYRFPISDVILKKRGWKTIWQFIK
jgi:hypothetical protein